MYVDASAAAMDAFINEHADGIVIAGSGDGSFNKSILHKSVNSAVKKGIAVVRSIKSSFKAGSYINLASWYIV
jgi:L-asparaginase/Glu-tRNA(Gln) amidotransferase subunit D